MDPTPQFGEFEEPAANGVAIVDVDVAGLNPVDQAIASGRIPGRRPPLPSVPGLEGVGTVDGRRVYFDTPVAPFGSMGERIPVERERADRGARRGRGRPRRQLRHRRPRRLALADLAGGAAAGRVGPRPRLERRPRPDRGPGRAPAGRRAGRRRGPRQRQPRAGPRTSSAPTPSSSSAARATSPSASRRPAAVASTSSSIRSGASPPSPRSAR